MNRDTLSIITAIIVGITIVAATSCSKDHDGMNMANIDYPAAYVVNGASNTISVIRLSDNTVTETISLNGATFPHHIYISPLKSKLAVAITGTDLSGGHGGHGGSVAGQKIQIIDAVTGMIDKEIAVAELPHNAVFNPSGTELWVPQGNETQGTVLIYNANDWSLASTINVGRMPSEVTFSVDGSMVFVANTMDATVSVINPVDKTVLATIAVGEDPVGAWPASNGKMYVDNETDQTISEIDVNIRTVTATIALGFKPGYAAYNSSNSELWVSDATNGQVKYYVFTGGVWTLAGNITTGADAHAIAFAENGSIAYVTNQGANTVSVINVANHAVVKTINVGEKPNGIVTNQ